jgi:hypothetical protein
MTKNWCILRIRNGKLENPEQVRKLFDQLRDGKWLMEIGQANKRSEQQNRYYFGIVVPLVQEGIKHLGTELTKQETHEFLKGKFNYQEIINKQTGEYIQVPRSTTILNKEAFSEYIAKIQQFSAEFLNVVIPDAGEQLTIQL